MGILKLSSSIHDSVEAKEAAAGDGGRVKRDALGRPMAYKPFVDEAVSR